MRITCWTTSRLKCLIQYHTHMETNPRCLEQKNKKKKKKRTKKLERRQHQSVRDSLTHYKCNCYVDFCSTMLSNTKTINLPHRDGVTDFTNYSRTSLNRVIFNDNRHYEFMLLLLFLKWN